MYKRQDSYRLAVEAARTDAEYIVLCGVGFMAESVAVLAPVSYTHLRAHETVLDLVCRLLLAKKKATHKKHTKL